MKLIESTLIVILTAPPVFAETGMTTVHSYCMFVRVVLCYLYILTGETTPVRKASQMNLFSHSLFNDRFCGLVVGVPGYRSRGPGLIPGAARFSEK
jgi:hypothetical protein